MTTKNIITQFLYNFKLKEFLYIVLLVNIDDCIKTGKLCHLQ